MQLTRQRSACLSQWSWLIRNIELSHPLRIILPPPPPLPPSFRPVTFFIGYRLPVQSALVTFTLHPNLLSKPVILKCRRWQIPNFLFWVRIRILGSEIEGPWCWSGPGFGHMNYSSTYGFVKSKIWKTSCNFIVLSMKGRKDPVPCKNWWIRKKLNYSTTVRSGPKKNLAEEKKLQY
jgi:hypothetical protein